MLCLISDIVRWVSDGFIPAFSVTFAEAIVARGFAAGSFFEVGPSFPPLGFIGVGKTRSEAATKSCADACAYT